MVEVGHTLAPQKLRPSRGKLVGHKTNKGKNLTYVTVLQASVALHRTCRSIDATLVGTVSISNN